MKASWVLTLAVALGVSAASASAQGAPAGGGAAGGRAGGGGGGGGRAGGAPPQPMGFFVTSVGMGNGANLGGLEGADRHCQTLAAAVSPAAGARTWRAYLSQTAVPARDGQPAIPAVNARDRIGTGPWYNATGTNAGLIARDVAMLHGDIDRDSNNVRKTTALNEKGQPVNGVGDMPNTHDMLTGSDSRGMALAGDPAQTTCSNWTSNAAGAAGGRAMLGHHDRLGGANVSWNAVHASNGCSQENLVATGGAGLFYCFAASPAPAPPGDLRRE